MNLEERHEAKQNLEIQQGQSTDVNAILQQWQTLVESANVVSQRRDVINGLFVTLSIAIITAVAALWDCRALPLLVAGCVMCMAWLLYLYSLKALNSAKFKVVFSLEDVLPCAPFKDEWHDLESRKWYVGGTTIERIMPISFIVLYIVMGILVVCM